MKEIHQIECGCYYLIESLATARSCYFEDEKEVEIFRKLFKRYLGKYVHIGGMYLSSEGYQILIRVRTIQEVNRQYRAKMRGKKENPKIKYLESSWRIISEQMRIMGSVYAKWVNKKRVRNGGLVKQRYKRYYFESKAEYLEYKERMDKGEEIQSQTNERYQVEGSWKVGVNWWIVRGVEWVRALIDKDFPDYVVSNLIDKTKLAHTCSSPP